MITSQITMKPVIGQNPAGFVPIVPLNNGYLQYVSGQLIDLEFPVSGLTYVTNDIPATQANFLALVKDEMDTNYLPSIFTDATKDYEVEITIASVKLDYTTPSSDRGIWTERTYKYFVKLSIKANVI